MQTFLQAFTSLMLLFNLTGFSSPFVTIDVESNQAEISYPETINFSLELSSSVEIDSVELVFGTDVISCGESQSRAIPEDYEPSKEVFFRHCLFSLKVFYIYSDSLMWYNLVFY